MIDDVVVRYGRRHPGTLRWPAPGAIPSCPDALPYATHSPWRREDDHQKDQADDSLESVRPQPVAHVWHPESRVVVDGGEHHGAYPRTLETVEGTGDRDH